MQIYKRRIATKPSESESTANSHEFSKKINIELSISVRENIAKYSEKVYSIPLF